MGCREVVNVDNVVGGGWSLVQQGPRGISGATTYHLNVLPANASSR